MSPHTGLRAQGANFISNLTFGPERQIAKKTAPLGGLSGIYADFISDLKFGSEHQMP
jgi:hypothetical protein